MVKAGLIAFLAGVLVFSVAGCGGQAQATATAAPDRPMLTEGEVIGLVQGFTKGLNVFRTTTLRVSEYGCFRGIDWSAATAEYVGGGRWVVMAKRSRIMRVEHDFIYRDEPLGLVSLEWEVYEDTLVVRSLNTYC